MIWGVKTPIFGNIHIFAVFDSPQKWYIYLHLARKIWSFWFSSTVVEFNLRGPWPLPIIFPQDRIGSDPRCPKRASASFRTFNVFFKKYRSLRSVVLVDGWPTGCWWFFYGAKMTKIQVSWRFLLVRLLRRQAKKPTEFLGCFFFCWVFRRDRPWKLFFFGLNGMNCGKGWFYVGFVYFFKNFRRRYLYMLGLTSRALWKHWVFGLLLFVRM